MHYHTNGSIKHSNSYVLSGSSQNFTGSCPGYISRKLYLGACVLHILD